MENQDISRRALLKGGGAAFAGFTALQVAGPTQAFGQFGEEVIPWIDQPPPPALPPAIVGNLLVWETLDSWFTTPSNFFYVRHFGQPDGLDESSWKVNVEGLVARPQSLTIADLKARERREVDFTLECSGDNGFPWLVGAIGNARWAGTPVAAILQESGLLKQASEVVFYGIDRGTVTIRDNGGILSAGQTGTLQQGPGGNELTITEQFARSMSLAEALSPNNLLCYEMNGEPLPPEHGFPVRLIAPGWYGVANVKWVTRIEVTDQRWGGRFMARDYVTIREQQRDGETVWTFATVKHERLKSAPAKVTRRSSNQYAIMGAAWGAQIAAVEVQIDDGPWMTTTLRSPVSRGTRRRDFSWVFWHFNWSSPGSGEHAIRSRAFDIDGNVQPAPEDPFLASKRTYWESNGQITRRVLIA
jgi:DMSO/TMAO reductase YedYZ molybdopterin-dependent catalytic subunit